MKKKRGFFIWRQKSYVIAGLLALIAVVAMAGMSYRGKHADNDQEKGEQASNYLTDDAGKDIAAMADQIDDALADEVVGPVADPRSGTETEEETEAVQTEETEETKAVIQEIYPEDPEVQNETPQNTLSFPGEGALLWPISGNVIMDYSVDRTIYFATLDQYRNNPAVMIQGQINDPVLTACAGQVIDVTTNEVTGCMVTMDIGDGYQAVYGQLKELECQVGDYLEQGETLGYLSEPTKYFIKEGSNLYFQITMNGEPLNPMIYLGQDENGA